MGTLQAGTTAMQRIMAGNKVLAAADVVDTTPIETRLSAFRAIHGNFVLAHDSVKQAKETLRKQRTKIEELGAGQRAAIEVLARHLPGDGFSRQNPFKTFGAPSPSVLKGMAVDEQAAVILELETAVLKNATFSQDSLSAAKSAGDAGRLVKDALTLLETLETTYRTAKTKREALIPAWERSFSSLKRATRMAEDDGHLGLFDALFFLPHVARKAIAHQRAHAPTPPSSTPTP